MTGLVYFSTVNFLWKWNFFVEQNLFILTMSRSTQITSSFHVQSAWIFFSFFTGLLVGLFVCFFLSFLFVSSFNSSFVSFFFFLCLLDCVFLSFFFFVCSLFCWFVVSFFLLLSQSQIISKILFKFYF